MIHYVKRLVDIGWYNSTGYIMSNALSISVGIVQHDTLCQTPCRYRLE